MVLLLLLRLPQAGGDVKLLDTLYPHLPNCRWVHSFFAGVDALGPFVRGNLTEGAGESIPLTNGKGAFSDSLAEVSAGCSSGQPCAPGACHPTWDRIVGEWSG